MRITINTENKKFCEEVSYLMDNGSWGSRTEMIKAAVGVLYRDVAGRSRTKQPSRNARLDDGILICNRLGGVVENNTCTYKITSRGETFTQTVLLENLTEEDIIKQNG
jgi:hypothetical protein